MSVSTAIVLLFLRATYALRVVAFTGELAEAVR